MEVGDYVRTKNDLGIQLICKINKIIDKYCINTDKGYWDTEYIIKSSPNIIDLIEVGDYVNGYLVKDIDYAFDDVIMNKKNARYVPYIDCNKNNYIDDIKSILTKEQFENCMYKIEK